MEKENIEYLAGNVKCEGYLCISPQTPDKAPAIILAHAWRGQDDFAREKAAMLANLGYAAFAADLYGGRKTAATDEEASALMLPLFLDRRLLQERINAAYNAISNHPRIDKSKIGAIGFCFGGLTVIELLRSGTPVKGVVSLHGVLGSAKGEKNAKTVPISSGIKGSLLAIHGHDDPLVSPEDLQHFQDEFTKAKVDWQLHIYGHAVHAFTNPEVHDRSSGLAFDFKANRRAWESVENFFREIFE